MRFRAGRSWGRAACVNARVGPGGAVLADLLVLGLAHQPDGRFVDQMREAASGTPYQFIGIRISRGVRRERRRDAPSGSRASKREAGHLEQLSGPPESRLTHLNWNRRTPISENSSGGWREGRRNPVTRIRRY
jgi:hypothetical protein